MTSLEFNTVSLSSERAILFADISGWVDLCSRLGDERALALRDALFIPLQAIVKSHGGQVVKTLGDELMCSFGSLAGAARAACDMQRHAEVANQRNGEPLLLRMGLNWGEVILRSNDVEGNTVSVAARIASNSKVERILLSRDSADMLPANLRDRIRPWGVEALKGKEDAIELVELLWRSGIPDTVQALRKEDERKQFSRLSLRCQGQTRTLEAGGKPLTFGRAPHNDLVVIDDKSLASSNQGKIELRAGTMVLTDNSSGGSGGIYITFDGTKFYRVNKSVDLIGSGRMTLGAGPDRPGVVVAEFEIE